MDIGATEIESREIGNRSAIHGKRGAGPKQLQKREIEERKKKQMEFDLSAGLS